MPESTEDLIPLVAHIVSAFVSHNSVPAAELPTLIASTHGALIGLGKEAAPHLVEQKLVPAVPIKKSITPDLLICLEDGLKFKSLRRHLNSKYGMTPAEYRQKWGLPADYPMVAPAYSEARSNLAKRMGLGQQRRKAAVATSPAKRARAKD